MKKSFSGFPSRYLDESPPYLQDLNDLFTEQCKQSSLVRTLTITWLNRCFPSPQLSLNNDTYGKTAKPWQHSPTVWPRFCVCHWISPKPWISSQRSAKFPQPPQIRYTSTDRHDVAHTRTASRTHIETHFRHSTRYSRWRPSIPINLQPKGEKTITNGSNFTPHSLIDSHLGQF